jgi:hypothetical protein
MAIDNDVWTQTWHPEVLFVRNTEAKNVRNCNEGGVTVRGFCNGGPSTALRSIGSKGNIIMPNHYDITGCYNTLNGWAGKF